MSDRYQDAINALARAGGQGDPEGETFHNTQAIAYAVLALVDELRASRTAGAEDSDHPRTLNSWAPGDVVTITGDDGKRTVLVRTERLNRWVCSEDPIHLHDDLQVDRDLEGGRVTIIACRGLAVLP